MHSTAHSFPENTKRALADETLQYMLRKSGKGFQEKRAAAAQRLPEFEDLRDQGRDLKNHVLEHLDVYLEMFEAKVLERGGRVHWCRTAQEARDAILGICKQAGAKTVTKGKSMIAEEVAVNDYLEEHGLIPIETDLGEYIIQLRKEPPSHIIAPAFHVSKEQVADAFRAAHTELPPDRSLVEPRELVTEARLMLRRKFQEADVGITGANFLVAETGSTIIVTNEGNGDLTQTLPKVHVVIGSIDKVIPTLEDVSTLLRLLARSATGQEFSAYTTFSTGPRRPGDLDGPEEFHVVLLDNGRSALLGTEFQDVLRCIRCGACMNHCPVYGAVGGHAYGWVYPGPIGAVLDPALIGIEEAGHLPNASTFCGRCEAVCPMRIPLPKMMRHWREKEFEQGLQPATMRRGIGVWGWFAKRPGFYHAAAKMAARTLRRFAGSDGRLGSLPFPMLQGWTEHRDLPAPEGRTFQELWAERQKGK
ncbi:LutB/LldF family L-lactate oxidation iron-sulfur protein [Azospirillum sp. sgz301742]